MSNKIQVLVDEKARYEIMLEHSFEALTECIRKLPLAGRKICIITDTNVEPLYANQVKEAVKATVSEVKIFTIPAGEQHKTLDTVRAIYQFLIEEKFDRKDMLIALGGGVVGDITGFAAATYLRGISFIQIPTTLLSQVDSSIGGKTGVDFDSYKNMVGAFHMPVLVYMNLSVLQSLPERQFASGMAEILKHGLIKNASYYEWIINHMDGIQEKQPAVLEEMIAGSCEIKKSVVERDPTEKGERALLNFGHTIGHAIEKYKNFSMLHGECVALGCVSAAYLSFKRNMLTNDEYYEIRDMFVPYALPISIEDIDAKQILELTFSDKKMDGGQIQFVLLDGIGNAVIRKDITDEEILEGIHEIIVKEEESYD